MSHQLQIEDWMWDQFVRRAGGGHPATPMRNALAVSLLGEPAPPRAQEVGDGSSHDRGTPIELKDWTRCTGCRAFLDEGTRALYRTDPDGSKQIYCKDCVRAESP